MWVPPPADILLAMFCVPKVSILGCQSAPLSVSCVEGVRLILRPEVQRSANSASSKSNVSWSEEWSHCDRDSILVRCRYRSMDRIGLKSLQM